MLIGVIGLILLLTFLNIAYYEYYYKKSLKKDKDIMKAYIELERLRNTRK